MLNFHCREHLFVYASFFFTLAFIALLSLSVAVQPHQLTSGRYFFIMPYLNFILVDKKKSKSLCGNNFVDTIYGQYTYIVGKYENYIFIRALETGRNASIWRVYRTRFAATGNELYIFRQIRISYLSCYIKSPKTTVKLSKKSSNTRGRMYVIT